jgi:hypothetical protein
VSKPRPTYASAASRRHPAKRGFSKRPRKRANSTKPCEERLLQTAKETGQQYETGADSRADDEVQEEGHYAA